MSKSHIDGMIEQAKLVVDHLEAPTAPDYRFVAIHAEALVQLAWAAIAYEEREKSQEAKRA